MQNSADNNTTSGVKIRAEIGTSANLEHQTTGAAVATVASNKSVLPLATDMLGDLEAPKRARWVFRLIALGLIALLIWAGVAKINQVTRAPAQVVVLERTQLVQSADGGILSQLHVQEGQKVSAGQLLVTLEKERAQAAVADVSAKVAALRAGVARLQAEVYERPLHFPDDLQDYHEYVRNQTDLYNRRHRAFLDDIASLQNILRLAKAELDINHKLEQTGDISRAEVLRLERAVADANAQLINRKNRYFQDAQAELTQMQEELNTQTEILRDRTQVLEQTELVAPLAAVVNNIKVSTVGGVVRSGETIMELLPVSDHLLVEAKVSSADIASVEVGQKASVKLDAYDSSIFGSLQGVVSYISPDVLTEETRNSSVTYYKVRIKVTGPQFDGAKGQEITLRPGLSGTVEIKARDRTVLNYLTKPITKTFSQSLGER